MLSVPYTPSDDSIDEEEVSESDTKSAGSRHESPEAGDGTDNQMDGSPNGAHSPDARQSCSEKLEDEILEEGTSTHGMACNSSILENEKEGYNGCIEENKMGSSDVSKDSGSKDGLSNVNTPNMNYDSCGQL